MGAGMKGFGWVRSGIAEEGTAGGFFSFRAAREAAVHMDRRSRTLRATSLMGRWKLALSTSSVMLLDWPHPRFCDGKMRVGQRRGGDRRRLVASSVARRARQHLRPAFAVHAGARLTGTGKKDRAIPAVGVDAPRSSRRRANESGSAEGSRTPSTTISSSRRWARAPPRGAGRVPWASSLSSFLPRFRPRNGKRDFPSRSGYPLCRQRPVGIDKRDACVCAMNGALTPILGASDFLRACYTPAGR